METCTFRGRRRQHPQLGGFWGRTRQLHDQFIRESGSRVWSVEAADEGNVYRMRWITPTIFCAISPGGKVVRRFVVDPGDEGFAPVAMHIASNRIAVLSFHEQTEEKGMKIVDLEGHEIAPYEEARIDGNTKNDILGLAFACYTANPQGFIFLTTGDGDRIEIQAAEGR